MRWLTALLMLTHMSTASAAEFEESGADLDLRLLQHDLAIQELDQRLKVLEAGDPPEPPPVPDPPPEPPEPDPGPTEPVTPVELGQEPVEQHFIPHRVQAEDFDRCSSDAPECRAYSDLDPENRGGQYRPNEGVDIKATGDESGMFQVGWINEGEWLEFTVGNPVAGLYDIHFRVAAKTPNPGSIRTLIDGQIVGQVQVPTTASWDRDFETVILRGVQIRGGNQIVRLEFLNGLLDLNWFEFTVAGEALNRAPTGIWLCPPDPVELALGRTVADTSDNGAKCDKGKTSPS